MSTVRKIFEFIKDLVVYPSKTPTIEVVPDEYGGCHRYRVRLCKGFRKAQNTHLYDSKTLTIQFVHHFLEDFFHIQPLLSIPLYHIRPQVVKLPFPLFGLDLLWQYHFTISSISSEWISTTPWKSRSLWIVFVSTI